MPQRFTNAFFEKFPQYVPEGDEALYAPKPPNPAIVEAVKKSVAARSPAVEAPVAEETAIAAPVESPVDDSAALLEARKKELLAAEGLRDDRTSGANLFEAIGQMAQGASGAQGAYDGSFYGKLRDQAAQGVADVGARQKSQADEQAFITKNHELKRTTALGDPNSTQSVVARNVARRRIQESGGDPSMIGDGMSALDVADLDKQVSGLETNATRKQTAADALASRELMARLAAQSKREAAAARADQAKGPQFQAAGFGKRVENATKSMDDLANSGYDRSDTGSAIRSALPNFAMSTEGQVQDQAERDFINAVLRRESGAAISKSEFQSGEQQYFPRQGDSEAVKAKKRNNRIQVLNSLQAEAGPAWNKIASAGTATGGTFPRKVKKGSKSAIVSNESELREAMSEGFN